MFQDDQKKLTRRGLLIGTVGVATSALVSPAYGAGPLVVIVNKGNSSNPSKSDLAAMFTTRKQSWGGGKRVVPFNFPAKHSSRVAFDKAILGMDSDDVARYWIDRRIRGGNAPPKQVSNAAMIVKLVEKLDGAVAYVPKSVAGGGVRIIKTI